MRIPPAKAASLFPASVFAETPKPVRDHCGTCRYFLASEDEDDEPEDDDDDDFEEEITEDEDDEDDEDEEGDQDEDGEEEDDEAKLQPFGFCRRYPPQLDRKGEAQFPLVYGTIDWCGEFIPK